MAAAARPKTVIAAAGRWSIYKWGWQFSGTQRLMKDHVPYFGAFGAAWVDAMVARWSVNPLGMLYRLSCLMLTVTQGTLPAGKSSSGGGADEGKPGDGDRVPSGDKKRGIVRTVGGVKGGRNATCNQPRDHPCKSWSRRRAVT